jgi:hypothetical protein
MGSYARKKKKESSSHDTASDTRPCEIKTQISLQIQKQSLVKHPQHEIYHSFYSYSLFLVIRAILLSAPITALFSSNRLAVFLHVNFPFFFNRPKANPKVDVPVDFGVNLFIRWWLLTSCSDRAKANIHSPNNKIQFRKFGNFLPCSVSRSQRQFKCQI